uniref:cellulase n=1 Tax=Aegilops tauschii subsp. strangulata TaxID=200361 RepID=A0A453KJ82_AEGTS
AYLIAVLCLVAGARSAAAFNYADALDKAVLFFEAQRSGKLPPGQRVAWRADSALSDGNASNVDLVGGYYDAGDNVKFGLPMAFTVTMLSWSVVEFGGAMPGGQVANAEAAVRWGSDYLLKAATATPGALYVQVADPYQDHRCWERAEDMDTPRAAYKVTPQSPGSDVAGETAAALAAASLVFRSRDPAYSSKLLRAARQVFDFADRYRGSYSDSLSSVVCPFYCSYSGYKDELLWAATWLHLASSPSPSSQGVYMSYINSNGHTLGAEQDGYTVSWDDKRAATKVLLSKVLLQNRVESLRTYKAHADKYICSLVPGAGGFQSQYTPGGLLFKEGDSNMEYVTSTAFLLLTYAKYLSSTGGAASCGSTAVTPSTLVSLAKKQSFWRARRWTTSWARTRRGCRTWWGSGRGTRGTCTTGAPPCRRCATTRPASAATRGSTTCTRPTRTATCSSAQSLAAPTRATAIPTAATTTRRPSRPPTPTRRSSAPSPSSRGHAQH